MAIGLCLSAVGVWVALGAHVTLSWTHSIQKSPRLETYDAQYGQMVLTEARISDTGAGMEPPDNATFDGHVWIYHPNRGVSEVRLQHSPYVTPYTVCTDTGCKPLPDWLPLQATDTAVLKTCPK